MTASMALNSEGEGVDQRAYRIFALDGGGIKCSFKVGVLAATEKDTEQRSTECFDMNAEISVNGIIGQGFARGLSDANRFRFAQSGRHSLFITDCETEHDLDRVAEADWR